MVDESENGLALRGGEAALVEEGVQIFGGLGEGGGAREEKGEEKRRRGAA